MGSRRVAIGLVASLGFVVLLSAWSQPAAATPLVITEDTVLKADVSGGLVVGANGITLDCAGHTISQISTSITTGAGVALNGRQEVTVKNCRVTGFFVGILLEASSSNTLRDNTATGNGDPSQPFGGGAGFALISSSDNLLKANTAIGNLGQGADGFDLFSSSDNTLTNNVATGNGNPSAPGGVGFAVLSSTGNTLKRNLAVGNNGRGFLLVFSSNTTLVGNSAVQNGNPSVRSGVGFALFSSSDNVLKGNTADENGIAGFMLRSSSRNLLQGNAADENGQYGFAFASASDNIVRRNEACGNGLFDAVQDATSTGNAFFRNSFCTTSGI